MDANAQLLQPPAALLMKVGFHGAEELDAIVRRKQKEIHDAGFCFWGYGGTLCHPILAVQPFMESLLHERSRVEVLFIGTSSPFHAASSTAAHYSVDGHDWKQIPEGNSVAASRHALVLTDLARVDGAIDASHYSIGIGPSEGKPLGAYLRGRVDKALVRASQESAGEQHMIRIDFRATLTSPYAILVR